jgi:deoxyribodipyrimidine photo-lyase
MQGVLRTHLESVPLSRPLTSTMPARLASLPAGIVNRLPHASDKLLGGSASSLRALPIDHDVTVVGIRGGAVAAEGALNNFVRRRVAVYHEHHNHPEDRGTSRLSPYLHFGHISSHQVFEKVMS